jgi:hypothetical protein
MTKSKVHLLYFEGCPNVEQARENMKKAIAASKLPLNGWEEVDTKRPETDQDWSGFPSPTVLINGANVENGERHREGTGSCRMGGAPSVGTILKGLERYGKG